MQKLSFPEALAQILAEDSRYAAEAYMFMRDGLDFTVRMMDRPAQGQGKHITGPELMDGLRNYATREFGPMARLVLDAWGIRCTEDFGEIVFNLIGKGIFGKTDGDRKEDFCAGYDFWDAFVAPFLPPSRRALRGNDDNLDSKKKSITPLGNG